MANPVARKIVLSSDHGGTELRQSLAKFCSQAGHQVVELGPDVACSVDYPTEVQTAVREYLAQAADFLILVCGSGVGVSIAANRHRQIRAVLTDNPYVAALSRQHNHANCLCLGQRVIGLDLAIAVLQAFLDGQCDQSERHVRRVKQLEELCQI